MRALRLNQRVVPVSSDTPPPVSAGFTLANRQQWAEVVEEHLPGIHRYVRGRVAPEAVDDLVQDVFVAAAGHVAQFDPGRGSTWQWLLGIARNIVAAHYRQTGRATALTEARGWLNTDGRVLAEALVSESPLPDEMCQRREFRMLARAALGMLEPHHQTCLIARYFDDRSLEEIAQTMKLSRAAANSLLHRARTRLRETLQGWLRDAAALEEDW